MLITGASGAIGHALAVHYAAPGRTLILHGRDESRLAAARAACECKGARVLTHRLDLRDRVALTAWLSETCDREAPSLVIVNAGVFIPTEEDDNPLIGMGQVLETNLLAAMHTVDAVLPFMLARGHGQIALMSSLAGAFGIPSMPSYSASKAALKAYGEALRGRLARRGIRISVIMPSFVESELSRNVPGPKTFILRPEEAAVRIAHGLARNKARIVFPFPMNFGAWLLAALPVDIIVWCLRKLGYTR